MYNVRPIFFKSSPSTQESRLSVSVLILAVIAEAEYQTILHLIESGSQNKNCRPEASHAVKCQAFRMLAMFVAIY